MAVTNEQCGNRHATLPTRSRMPRRRVLDLRIRLTDPDRQRWLAAAEQLRIPLQQLVREAVELAIARGSTR